MESLNETRAPRRVVGRFGALLAAALATMAALTVVAVSVVSASAQANNDKVTICHRRAAVTNPYGPKAITVDQSSIFNNGIVPNGHGTHTGPIFPLTGPDGKWGDIIPPFDGYPGQNFTAEGQAILANDCQIPGPPPTTTPATTTPATTTPGGNVAPGQAGTQVGAAGAVVAQPQFTG